MTSPFRDRRRTHLAKKIKNKRGNQVKGSSTLIQSKRLIYACVCACSRRQNYLNLFPFWFAVCVYVQFYPKFFTYINKSSHLAWYMKNWLKRRKLSFLQPKNIQVDAQIQTKNLLHVTSTKSALKLHTQMSQTNTHTCMRHIKRLLLKKYWCGNEHSLDGRGSGVVKHLNFICFFFY